METKREDVVMASDITKAAEAVEKNQPTSPEVVAAIQEAERRNALETDPAKKTIIDPMKDPRLAAAAKKALKEYLARQPKHENFKPCLKKCSLFKECQCFKKTSAQQKECWDTLMAALSRFGDVKPVVTDCRGRESCESCEALKKCLVANKELIKKELEEADAREKAAAAKPT